MTKKQLRRLRRMKEVNKQDEEIKPDYTEKDEFWGKSKNNKKKTFKADRLDGDDFSEWKKLFMEEMRTVWDSKKEKQNV